MKDVKRLLPIGSVVRLKSAKKDLMVFGICQTQKDTGKEFDYIGVLWPEGNMGVGTQLLFSHDNIESVTFMGFDTPERQDFIDRLQVFYESAK